MKRYTGISNTPKSNSSLFNSKTLFGARVYLTILDDTTNPDLFKQYGDWSSIGGILFQSLSSPSPVSDFSKLDFARPLFPNVKNYPLTNEIVVIIPLPSNEIEGNPNAIDYYYFNPINLWSSNHHNAIPNSINFSNTPNSQKQDYQQTEAGSVRRVQDGSTEIDLGYTFKEKLDIKPLLPYEGDYIIEGRWGNSLRFGSTVNNGKIKNTWSENGENGNPITIIRNGQFEDNKDPWIPTVEDINKDISSLWITSTQIIPVEVSSKDYNSFSTPPIEPNKYNESQLIFNSNRILLNSKKDSILLSSKKSINLNSQESVNIDSPKSVISSKEVLLGSKDATEPLILGDSFMNEFKNLLKKLSELCSALPTVGTTTPYTPNISVANKATQLKVITDTMYNKLDSFKSKVSKTK